MSFIRSLYLVHGHLVVNRQLVAVYLTVVIDMFVQSVSCDLLSVLCNGNLSAVSR